MRLKTGVVVLILCLCPMLVSAQPDASAPGTSTAQSAPAEPKLPFIGNARIGFNPTIIQPGSHVFFPTGITDAGEIPLFKDGKIAVDLQLFGGDLVHYVDHRGRLRVGINSGLGITQLNDASVLLINVSGFLQIGEYYRIDLGYVRGKSGKDGLTATQSDRSALFVGVSFPTKINELLEKAIKGSDEKEKPQGQGKQGDGSESKRPRQP